MENNLSSADELKTIRKIMEESSRFLSLSGLSGVFSGLLAIAGALVAWLFMLNKGTIPFDDPLKSLWDPDSSLPGWQIIADASIIFILSLSLSLLLSVRKARKAGRSLWTPVTKRLLLNFFIPLTTGGIFIIILLIQGHIQLLVPGMLIFYGLALLNAGKFTYGEIFYLGCLEVILGLISALMPSFGLYFWVFGFGLLHIVYGFFMYRKYES